MTRGSRTAFVAPECACAYPGPLPIETPFAIPDTTQASFRDDKASPHDRVATDSDLAPSFLVVMAGLDPAIQSVDQTPPLLVWMAASRAAMTLTAERTTSGSCRSCR